MDNILAKYPWAQNKSKLERAYKEVVGKVGGADKVTEEAVKAVYVRLLGKVIDLKEEVEAPEEKESKLRKNK